MNISSTDHFGFDVALQHLSAGKRVSNADWVEKGTHVITFFPKPESNMTDPFLYIRTAEGKQIPWMITHMDLFSKNWFLIE